MKKKHAFILGLILIAVILLWRLGQNNQTPQTQPPKILYDQNKQEIQRGNQQSSSHQQQAQRSQFQKGPAMSASELEAYGRKAIAEQAARNEDFEKNGSPNGIHPFDFSAKSLTRIRFL